MLGVAAEFLEQRDTIGVVAVVFAALPGWAAGEDDGEGRLGEKAAELGDGVGVEFVGVGAMLGTIEHRVDAELDEVGRLVFGEAGIGKGRVDRAGEALSFRGGCRPRWIMGGGELEHDGDTDKRGHRGHGGFLRTRAGRVGGPNGLPGVREPNPSPEHETAEKTGRPPNSLVIAK